MRALLVAALCTGCAADPPRCIEDYRTVTAGIYGEAKYVDANMHSQPLIEVPISISTLKGFVDLRTDEHGLFEIAEPNGSYQICSDFLHVGCDQVYLDGYMPIDLQRVDLHVDEGVGAFWDFASSGCL